MNRRTFFQAATAAAALAQTRPLAAQSSAPQTAPRFGDGRDWWFQKRFGMFVHWGLYAIHGYHEQEQWRLRVPRSEYVKLQQQWNPVKFDPDAWLDLAAQAGMKYICLTSKHHDGFCLWDTKQTAYNTMNTPYGKDVVRLLSDACAIAAVSPSASTIPSPIGTSPTIPTRAVLTSCPRSPATSPTLPATWSSSKPRCANSAPITARSTASGGI